MNIEKWLDMYSFDSEVKCVDVSDLRELLKIHVIVPREPGDEQLFAMAERAKMHDYDYMRELYLSAIKAAENEQ